jgi:hypothetical protein
MTTSGSSQEMKNTGKILDRFPRLLLTLMLQRVFGVVGLGKLPPSGFILQT